MLTNVQDWKSYPKISNSELYALGRCKKMWDYSYRQGLVPATTPDYLSKGSFVHDMIAQYIESVRTDDVPKTLFELSLSIQTQAIKEGKPTVDEATRIETLEQVKDFFAHSAVSSANVVAVEEEFYADIGLRNRDDKPVLLHGFVDAVVRDDNDSLWLIEHKTAARAWSVQQFQFAVQDVLYIMAWKALTGDDIMGTQYNFFYPKRWEVKQKFVDTAQFQSVLDDLQAAVYMRDDLKTYPREPLYGCGGCQFRDLCYTELVGGDGSFIRKHQFVVDDVRRNRFDVE
jgi:hypothetical protein